MNYGQRYEPTGALEINLRASAQKKYLDAMEAAWMSETRPARVEKRSGMKVFFAGLRDGLLSLSGRQLASANQD